MSYRADVLFDVHEIRHGEWAVLVVIGEIDLATLPTLAGRISSDRNSAKALDLSGVDYFDPLCSGLLVTAHLRAIRNGGRFAVVAPDGRTRDFLVESGLATVLSVLNSRDELVSAE